MSKCDIALTSEYYPEFRLKYYENSSAYINMSVENSLKNLNTDYLDLLLIHHPDPLMNAEQTGTALDILWEGSGLSE
ncbi:MAG: putative oxidoreductase [Granulosicoccus sp.]|jgi:predicted oxidoreductase